MTSRHTSFLLLIVVGVTIYDDAGVTANPVRFKPLQNGMLATEVPRSKTALTMPTVSNRPSCNGGQKDPPSRVDTTQRVANLREQMEKAALAAYIIPRGDEHQSEQVAAPDERLKYISGFSGSAGIAIVTMTQQALWTDGRYFLQAEDELDCNWILMKNGEAFDPNELEWLGMTLPPLSRVGADPKLIGAETWLTVSFLLQYYGLEVVVVEENLVDLIWKTDGRPDYVSDPIFIHELKYAGKSWQDKVEEVRNVMIENKVNMLILTALDEIAWLLNLRGNDIPYNSVFHSYVTVTPNELNLFVSTTKIRDNVREHFAAGSVKISEYNNFWAHLATATGNVVIPGASFYAAGTSYAVYSKIKTGSRFIAPSPVILMKAQKNEVEIKGMKNAHVKDAVALCDFLSFMETEIALGKPWTELSASRELSQYRAMQEGAMGDSFATISGFGPNGAVIHYEPSLETDANLTSSSIYLLDSGGQYLDGTTDVTRTLHYGEPTSLMIETYTRVLMGHIDLATAVFPKEILDSRVDILARKPLYEIGLDYNHGTGHGIGMFLGIHEAPTKMHIERTGSPFQPGYFFSVEPGYYKDHEFGIRLENIMMVIEKDTKYSTKPMFAFEAVTLVPFETKLINTTLLNKMQCDWLNSYHEKVLNVVGKELLTQNRTEGYNWLETKTKPLHCSAPGTLTISLLLLLVALYTSTIHQRY